MSTVAHLEMPRARGVGQGKAPLVGGVSRRRVTRDAAVAVVVSPHGFGHAARISAVIESLCALRSGLEIHLLTTVPRWFFADGLSCPFKLHRLTTDVGLVQRTPLAEDLEATARRLDRLLAPGSGVLDRITNLIGRLGCRLVICDISPLGLAAARRLGLPSVLVENFTWDWIYRGYDPAHPGLEEHARTMARLFEDSDLHIQTRPWCRTAGDGWGVAPVARRPSTSVRVTRNRFDISDADPLVLLTMGGVSWDYRALAALESHRTAHFVVPGGADRASRRGRLTLLPFRSGFHHPDLVAAADVVVGKLGYSTVAEAHQSGAAMAYIGRPRFRESQVLADFVGTTMNAVEITEDGFNDGSWVEAIDGLLLGPRQPPRVTDGAQQAARLILDRFDGELG